MTAIAFDTLRFTKHLTEAGASRELAEATAEAFKEASGEAEIATKGDLREMEHRLHAEFTRLNGEVRLIRWTLAVVTVGILSLVLKTFFA